MFPSSPEQEDVCFTMTFFCLCMDVSLASAATMGLMLFIFDVKDFIRHWSVDREFEYFSSKKRGHSEVPTNTNLPFSL
jgi:hypothetical protein